MTYELDDKSEREKIIDIGFAHIRTKLGYKEGGLISWTTEGENLSYEIGVLVCIGLEGEKLMTQESDLLKKARELIEQNRRESSSYEMDSGP